MTKTGWPGVLVGALPSALLHIGIAALIFFTLPDQKKPKATPLKVPVEIVRPLEKKPEKKKPLKKLTKKKPNKVAKKKPEPVPKEPEKEAKPKPPQKPKPPAKREPQLAEKVKPKPPEPKKAEPKKTEPKKAEPAKDPPRAAEVKEPKPPEQNPKPKKAEKQLAEKEAKPKPKSGGRKVKPEADNEPQISMIQRKLVGRWVLQPLKVNLKHRCGKASLSGVINLTKKRGNRFTGTLRTTIHWTRCPAEGAVYQIVLLIRGNRVVMLDAGGVLDRGLIKGNVMVLKDAYGPSFWLRSR